MPNDRANELLELERKRKLAFVKYDARSYCSLCDELGTEPEDEELYDQGQREMTEEKEGATRGDAELLEKYGNFLKDSCNINLAAHEENTETKKTLLRKYFMSFMPGKSQDLDRMSNKEVGFEFETVVLRAAQSKKEAQKQKR